LYSMDQLREGIGLRAYGQKDPLLEYKRDGFEMFSDMMAAIKEEVVPVLLKVQRVHQEEVPQMDANLNMGLLQESRSMALPGMAAPPETQQGSAAEQANSPVQPVKRQF